MVITLNDAYIDIATYDTPDTALLLSHINDDLNMLVYLTSAIMGFAVAILICYLMYIVIKWCIS